MKKKGQQPSPSKTIGKYPDFARQTYNNKYLVEDDFKLLNDELLVPIGPIYHTKDFNIRVHVFLAVMGLLFYRYLAWKTKKYNLSLKEIIAESWEVYPAILKND